MAKTKKKPGPEPVVSTAWRNNEAFHGTLGVLRGLARGLVAAFVIGAICIAAGASPVIIVGSVLTSIIGFTAYAGYKAHDRALRADKPKPPKSGPEPYDPNASRTILQARGVNVPAPAPPLASAPPATPPLPAGVRLAPGNDVSGARSELASLSTRYQDTIRQQRERAANPENVRNR